MKWFAFAILVVGLSWYFMGRNMESEPVPVAQESAQTNPSTTHQTRPLSENPTTPLITQANLAPDSKPNGLEPISNQIKDVAPVLPPKKFFDLVLKNSAGKLQKHNQAAAIKACADHGLHLPTIRELAQWAKTKGAKGILEVDQLREEDKRAGYELVEATNSDKRKDFFYYSGEGFAMAPGENRDVAYWSSSLCIGCETNGRERLGDSSHVMYGDGKVRDHYDSLELAVRCVSTR